MTEMMVDREENETKKTNCTKIIKIPNRVLLIFLRFICVFFAFPFFFNSCEKNKQPAEVEVDMDKVSASQPKAHEWFYFTNDSFSQTVKPQIVSSYMPKPWTEAVRISSSSCIAAENGQTQKAYMIVNRLGILCIDGKNVEFCKDLSLFPERTAGNLVFMNDMPIFSLYKSAFFNDPTKDNQHPFLVQFDPTAKIAYPLVNCDNLTDLKACEVVDFIWNNNDWLCCIKSEEKQKNTFTYLKWTPKIPLLSLSPVTASENITIEESDVDAFRKEREPLPFSESPERIRKLLTGLPSTVPFNLTIHTAGGASPRLYSNVPKDDEKALYAFGIISQTWSGILFQDGTLYLEGALDCRRILRGGKSVAIRLPRLPYGYIYTSFVISGTTLYTAWEESDFYKTGKSGFLKVDLDETLYRDIRY